MEAAQVSVPASDGSDVQPQQLPFGSGVPNGQDGWQQFTPGTMEGGRGRGLGPVGPQPGWIPPQIPPWPTQGGAATSSSFAWNPMGWGQMPQQQMPQQMPQQVPQSPTMPTDVGEMGHRMRAIEEEIFRLRTENAALQSTMQQQAQARFASPPRRQQRIEQPASPTQFDARMVDKPKSFDGSDENWPTWKYKFVSYMGVFNMRLPELLKAAESVEDVANVDLRNNGQNGDEALSNQLYYILSTMVEGRASVKARNTPVGEGLALWKRLLEDYEPRIRARTTNLLHDVLSFKCGELQALDALEAFEKDVLTYEKATGTRLDPEIKGAVFVAALAASTGANKAFADHAVMHSDRLTTFENIQKELVLVSRTSKFVTKASNPAINALGRPGKGDGRGGPPAEPRRNGRAEGELVIKFKGACFVCGKVGHPARQCPDRQARAKAEATPAKPVNAGAGGQGKIECRYCHRLGHKEAECRKKKADAAAGKDVSMKAATPTHSPGDTDGKRKRIAALTLEIEQLKVETGTVGSVTLSMVGSSEQQKDTNHPSVVPVQVDSGAEVTVWPTSLWPDAAETLPTPESLKGQRYWGPGDVDEPTIPDQGRREYQLNVPGCGRRALNVRCAPVRRALLAVADLNDLGHDVFFLAPRDEETEGNYFAEQYKTGEITRFVRRGKRFEMDAEIIPFPRQGTRL